MSKYIVKAIMPMVLTLFVLSNVISISVFAAQSTAETIIKSNNVDIKADEVITKGGTGYVTNPASGEFGINQIQQATLQSTTGSAIIKNSINKKEVVFLLDSSGSLSYTDRRLRPVFSYGIFSGSGTQPFKLENTTVRVNGDVHSNAYIYDSSMRLAVNGICESVGVHNITNVGSYDWEGRTESSVFKDHVLARELPEISEVIKDETKTDYKIVEIKPAEPGVNGSKIKFTIGSSMPCTQNSGDLMLKQSGFPSWYGQPAKSVDPDFPAGGFADTYLAYNTNIQGDKITRKDLGTFVITGPDNFKFKIGDKQTYYFDGNVIASSGVFKFEGSGRLIAKGDIIIEGTGLSTKAGTSSVIYSEGGSVRIQSGGSAANFNGIIYAPNGAAHLATTNIVVNGSVVADKVFVAADNIKINASPNYGPDKDIINTYNVSYFETAKATINTFKNYIQSSPSGSSTKIGILQYNESANDNDFVLHDISTTQGSIDLDDRLRNIMDDSSKKPSNLGDGLRRAYELLKSGDNEAAKYVVVISGALPNAWTILPKDGPGDAKKIGCYYKEGEPDSILTTTAASISTELCSDVNKGSSYAMEQVKKINSLNKVSVPNTSFVAVCANPDRQDYPDISDKGWQQILNSCSNLKTLLPAAFNSVNNNKNVIVYTGNDLLESAANSIIASIPSQISNFKVDQASITLNIPSGHYFKTTAVKGIKLDESEGLNLLDCIDGAKASNTVINKTITGSSIVLKPGENKDEIIFTTPKVYVPLKYVEIASDPTKSETKETLNLTGSIDFNLVCEMQLPTGDMKQISTSVKMQCIPCSVVIKDAIDIN